MQPSGAAVVYGLGEHLFARTRLAGDEHRKACRRRAHRLFFQAEDGRVCSENAIEGVALCAQGKQLLFVQFEFGLEKGEFFGELSRHRSHA